MTLPARAASAAALPIGAVLAVDPGGLAPFGPAKWTVVSVLVLLAAVAAPRRGRLQLARRPAWVWGALLAAVGVSAGLGADPLYTWIGTPERRLGVLAWVLFAVVFVVGQQLDEARARLVVAATAVAAGLCGLWATAEVLGWEPIRLTGVGDRPVGPFGSSAYLGAAVVLVGPAIVGLAVERHHLPSRRWLGGGATVLAGVALVASGARAAWFGAVVAGLIVVALRRPAISRARMIGFGGMALAVAALAALTGVAGRVPDAFGSNDGGMRGRLDEWRVASGVVAEHPLVGVGPEGYRIAFGASVDDAYEQAHGRDPLPDRAHAAPLDVAATLGLPGLAAWLVLVVIVGGFLLRAIRQAPSWVVGAAAGVVAYGVQSLFLFPLAELDPVAWLLAGLVVGRVAVASEVTTVPAPAAGRVVAAALAMVALVVGGLDLVADRAARRTLSAVADGDLDVDGGQAARLRPDAVRYRLVAARAAVASGTAAGLADALDQLDRALDVSPEDPVVRGEQARLLLERARRTGSTAHREVARTALEDLAEDDPRNAEVLLRLGVIRALDDDLPAATEAWLVAERLAPQSAAASVDVAVAYRELGDRPAARAAAERALEREPGNQRAVDVLRWADGTD